MDSKNTGTVLTFFLTEFVEIGGFWFFFREKMVEVGGVEPPC